MKSLAIVAALLCAAPAFAQDASDAPPDDTSSDSSSSQSQSNSAPSSDASTSTTANSDSGSGLRRRYSPGFAIGLLTDVRGYEGLTGAATAAGVSLGYAFDLVSVNAQVLQSFAVVGERKPTLLKANFDFAVATFGGFSFLGTVGIDYILSGPDRQTTQSPGNLWGPEIGAGARYRVMPLFDVVAYGTAGLWAASGGPRRMYFEPGVIAGLQFHPFAD